MSISTFRRRGAFVAAFVVIAAVSAACDDSDPMDPDPEPDIHSVRVEIEGGQFITFNRQRVASGPLTFGNNAVVEVSFFGPEGEPEEILNASNNFELRVNFPGENPGMLVFTPSGLNSFAGTFTRTNPTTEAMIVQFELWHLTDNHSDGRWNAQVNVE